MFQTALMKNWQTARQMDQYWKLVTDGRPEEALDRFVENPANRMRVIPSGPLHLQPFFERQPGPAATGEAAVQDGHYDQLRYFAGTCWIGLGVEHGVD